MRGREDRGFALPVTVFVITIVTLLLMSAFVRIQGDRRMSDGTGATVDALAVAQAGLQRYYAFYDSTLIRPLDGDSLRINVQGGFADVVARLVKVPADSFESHLYLVRSRGTVIVPAQGPDPQAVRTVAQFANWFQGGVRAVAAYTAINENDYYSPGGASVTVSGDDACSGALVGGFRGAGGQFSDVPPITAGNPLSNVSGTQAAVLAEVGVDWAAIEAGDLTPDYASFAGTDSTYPTYVLSADPVVLSDVTGFGLLVVLNRLDTGGIKFEWNGVVLVGGDLDPFADTTRINGLLITGMDEAVFGGPQLRNDFTTPSANIEIQYNSCQVYRALEKYRGFDPIENAWIDNWAEY